MGKNSPFKIKEFLIISHIYIQFLNSSGFFYKLFPVDLDPSSEKIVWVNIYLGSVTDRPIAALLSQLLPPLFQSAHE